MMFFNNLERVYCMIKVSFLCYSRKYGVSCLAAFDDRNAVNRSKRVGGGLRFYYC